ncbi:hypothetical protein J6590_042903 [Homalodisca vitripennis]|nr:hypothetical protein J6590_042903 [Homalodisca vitripennis]
MHAVPKLEETCQCVEVSVLSTPCIAWHDGNQDRFDFRRAVPPAAVPSCKCVDQSRATGNFRREHKKVTESKRSGAGTDAVHVPKLWYYKLLLFLSDQEEVRLSITSLDSPTEDSQQTGAGHAVDDVLSECEEDEDDPRPKEQSQPETSTLSTSSAPTFGRKKRVR